MRIECTKSEAPIGVIGRERAKFVFCPANANSSKISVKVPAEQCFACTHNQGEHIVGTANPTRINLRARDAKTRKVIDLTGHKLTEAIINQIDYFLDNLLSLTPEQLADWATSRHAEAIKIIKD